MSTKYLRFINDNFWTIVSVSSALVLIGFLFHGAYQGYHSEENTKYREVSAAADAATTYDDDATVKRYVDSSSRMTIREFTAHDGKLLCVATLNHRGNTISCVKIEQSCKASY